MDVKFLKTTIAGLGIGTLVLCANFQFGLQTGWVSMMSMPAALLGFAVFKVIKCRITPQENVYIQSVAIAVGTGPLSFGLVGAIPAIQLLLTDDEGRLDFPVWKLVLWSLAIGYIGISTAVLIRHMILKHKSMRFPSGTAAAALIGVLHDKPIIEEEPELQVFDHETASAYYRNIRILSITFVLSFLYTLLSKIWTVLQDMPAFGSRALKYLWTFELSPAYIGQGMIMGLPTTLAMLIGTVLGWGVLAPLAKNMGWAPSEIDDWKSGAQGWIMWVSLAIMVADTLVSFVLLTYHTFNESLCDDKDDVNMAMVESNEQVKDQRIVGTWGMFLSSLVCVLLVKLLFKQISTIAVVVAVLLSPFLSLLGVRSLGETDLNPVSSIAKLTQLAFGIIMRGSPHAVLFNIIAGAITEAGAEQAGDLMQDFKTGILVNAPMSSQTLGMLIGTTWSVLISGVVYNMYIHHFEIPGDEFRIPTSYIWADGARLMAGESLPPRACEFALAFGMLFVWLAILKHRFADHPYAKWIPSGVAVGIGMYNVPKFTLARFLGGVLAYVYGVYNKNPDDNVDMVIWSSGLILGEGIMSVLYLFFSI